MSIVRSMTKNLVDRSLGRNINAACWFVDQDECSSLLKNSSDCNLLLIATRKIADALPRTCAFDRKRLAPLVRNTRLLIRTHNAPSTHSAKKWECQIFSNRERLRKALAAAIFTHSCRTRFQRQFTKPSTTTRANEATDADNFTPANLEGTCLKTNLCLRTRTAGLQLFHHASRHRSHKRVIIKHRKFATFHDRAISQDRRTIGNTTYFIKSMRDKRNGDSRLGHCANCIPKLICFDPSKRTCWFVKK